MAAIRLGIVDDHPVLVEGLAAILGRSGRFDVVFLGENSSDIVRLPSDLDIDVLLIDLNMPGDVFAAIEEARFLTPATRLLVFTASTSADHAVRALAAGAAGFVLKGSGAQELFHAIEAVHRGETYISPSFSARVIAALQAKGGERNAAERLRLSYREAQIVKLLMSGKQNREIAAALDLSEKTVKSYMTNLMSKLRVRNRLEVVIAAQKLISGEASTSVNR